ncbi:MoxR-like ATPase [Cellulosimicrobium cellulans]|nr:MoxR-like ATPase [Cellulosimicrobium cellulans]
MTHHPDGSVPQPDRYAPPPHQEQPYTQDPSVADRVSAAAGGPGHEPGPHAPGAPTPGYGAAPPAAYGQPGVPAPAPVHDAPPAPSPELRQALAAVRTEVGKAVVGQDGAVTSLLIALLCKGHVLLEGVPGVAKTLLVRTLAASLDLGTKRVQFTPDLMPGDVTGSLVYDARTAEFSFREGPVFTNLLLADEINRTPPKTQASLLEAMEERQVSVDGTPRPLPDPFLVIATQNPVEYEGTYPLPEAQLDRFLLKVVLPLPEREQEVEVLARHAAGFNPRDLAGAGVRPVAGRDVLDRARAEVARVQVAREVLGYAVDVCRATRHSPSLSLGVSPRGATALLATARAWAWLSGRSYVTPDDVKALAHPTLRHRVQLRPEAELEGVTAESVLDTVLASVPVPR